MSRFIGIIFTVLFLTAAGSARADLNEVKEMLTIAVDEMRSDGACKEQADVCLREFRETIHELVQESTDYLSDRAALELGVDLLDAYMNLRGTDLRNWHELAKMLQAALERYGVNFERGADGLPEIVLPALQQDEFAQLPSAPELDQLEESPLGALQYRLPSAPAAEPEDLVAYPVIEGVNCPSQYRLASAPPPEPEDLVAYPVIEEVNCPPQYRTLIAPSPEHEEFDIMEQLRPPQHMLAEHQEPGTPRYFLKMATIGAVIYWALLGASKFV